MRLKSNNSSNCMKAKAPRLNINSSFCTSSFPSCSIVRDKLRRESNFLFLFISVLLLVWSPNAMAKPQVIKTALITPEGSAWTNMLREMAAEIEEKTNGEVQFKIYAGGISGDELDVIRKMKVNRIHAAGFSGVGLGVILPEIRILEAPLLFNDYSEVDLIREAYYDKFSKDMEDHGFVLLGFAEAGFVYLFSKTDISAPNWITDAKMWAWKGDPVAENYFKAMGITTYPLHLTDVNTGLETGMIDSFYSPPLGAVAFQWYPKIRYMLDYPMVNSTGALVMKKTIFDKISPENQSVLKALSRQYCNKLIEVTRQDNIQAIDIMKQAGVMVVSPTQAQIATFKNRAESSYDQNIPALYSLEFLTNVKNTLMKSRKSELQTQVMDEE